MMMGLQTAAAAIWLPLTVLLLLTVYGHAEITVEPLRCYHCSENENCNENLGIASPCRSVYDRCATFYDSATAACVLARGCFSYFSGCYELPSKKVVCMCPEDDCNNRLIIPGPNVPERRSPLNIKTRFRELHHINKPDRPPFSFDASAPVYYEPMPSSRSKREVTLVDRLDNTPQDLMYEDRGRPMTPAEFEYRELTRVKPHLSLDPDFGMENIRMPASPGRNLEEELEMLYGQGLVDDDPYDGYNPRESFLIKSLIALGIISEDDKHLIPEEEFDFSEESARMLKPIFITTYEFDRARTYTNQKSKLPINPNFHSRINLINQHLPTEMIREKSKNGTVYPPAEKQNIEGLYEPLPTPKGFEKAGIRPIGLSNNGPNFKCPCVLITVAAAIVILGHVRPQRPCKKNRVAARGCTSVNQQGCFEDYSGEYICACATTFCNDFAVSSVAVDSLTDLRNAYHLWNGKVPTRPRQLTPIPIARQQMHYDQVVEKKAPAVEAASVAEVEKDLIPEKPLSLAARLTRESMNHAFKATSTNKNREVFPPIDNTPVDTFLSKTAGNNKQNGVRPLMAPANVQASPNGPPPEAEYNGMQLPKMSTSITKNSLMNFGRTIEEFLNPESRPGKNLVTPVYNAEGLPMNFVAPTSQIYSPPSPKPVAPKTAPPAPKLKPISLTPKKSPLKPAHLPSNAAPLAPPPPPPPQPSYQVIDKNVESAVLTLPPGLIPNFGRSNYVQQPVPNIAVVVVPPVVANVPVEKKTETPVAPPRFQQPQEAVRYVPLEVKAPKDKSPFKSFLKSAMDLGVKGRGCIKDTMSGCYSKDDGGKFCVCHTSYCNNYRIGILKIRAHKTDLLVGPSTAISFDVIETPEGWAPGPTDVSDGPDVYSFPDADSPNALEDNDKTGAKPDYEMLQMSAANEPGAELQGDVSDSSGLFKETTLYQTQPELLDKYRQGVPGKTRIIPIGPEQMRGDSYPSNEKIVNLGEKPVFASVEEVMRRGRQIIANSSCRTQFPTALLFSRKYSDYKKASENSADTEWPPLTCTLPSLRAIPFHWGVGGTAIDE
ncbi:unnamed protein product [Notodromas monacha]|uniref:Uncharacterized protein n=1 Tax=Notodromas monacha TaxID=399045 RepID=A0A7R9BSS0_9CRUS|nr:unnamed protein product [Notodromas monacha]CAG0920008.1 unnamed protein product [Notodromas monacha]